MNKRLKELRPTLTTGAHVTESTPGNWRLEIPAGPRGRYRLAQLDDYDSLPRREFPWQAPFYLELEARASAQNIPGTWGFGVWDNPFGMAILSGAEVLRLPGLPNTAWFFYGAAPNYLSLRDDLPAEGWLAATFHSPRVPAPLLALGALGLPLLILPATTRLLRRMARRVVGQEAKMIGVDPTGWHTYRLEWMEEGVIFSVDQDQVLAGHSPPRGPLGMVIWVDNQFAALPPNGKLRFGTLENPEPAWVEIRGLRYGAEGERSSLRNTSR